MKNNELKLDDVKIILNLFNNVESVRKIDENKYQVHISNFNYSCTLIVLLKDGIINSVSLLNAHDN